MNTDLLKAKFRTEALYQAYQPVIHLQDFIHEYWIMHLDRTAMHSKRELELPNLYPEIIFKYGEDYEEFHIHKQREVIHSKSIVSGINAYAKASKRVNTNHELLLIGVKFKPVGMYAILNSSLYQLYNLCISLDDLNRPDLNELEERLFFAKSRAEILSTLNSAFQAIFLKSELPREALQLMREIEGMDHHSLRELRNDTKFSYKQLERKFKRVIGANPKQYFKLKRFNHFYRDLLQLKNYRYIDLVYKHHYFDQNHLIKDFKAILNTSPNKFLKTRNEHFTQHIMEAHLYPNRS